MPATLKIFICDDSLTFRHIVWNYLENMEEYTMVGEAADGLECLEKIATLEIDVILMDINMPKLNGVQTAKIIHRQSPGYPKIIALTQHDEFEYTRSMIEAGAKGYILKSEVGKHLIKAIEKVMEGKFYFPEQAK